MIKLNMALRGSGIRELINGASSRTQWDVITRFPLNPNHSHLIQNTGIPQRIPKYEICPQDLRIL